MDNEDYQHQFNHRFETTKRLSDYVAAVIRVAILVAAQNYFYAKWLSADYLMRTVFVLCWFYAFLLTMALCVNLIQLTIIYLNQDVVHLSKRRTKIVHLILALILTAIVYVGVQALVRDIAASMFDFQTSIFG